jgi:hypothetical protein
MSTLTKRTWLGGLALCGALGAAAVAVFCPCPGTAQAQGKDAKEGSMKREEAVRLAKAYAAAHGVKDSPGLNDKNLGGLEIEGHTVYFEYQPEAKQLESGALIYKFHKPPKPKVLEAFQQEEQAGTDTGGGHLYYEPKNQGLFLRRFYKTAPSDAQFIKDTDRLRKASQVWADQVLDRVATKVFG